MIGLARLSRTVHRLQTHTVDMLESASEWRLLQGNLLKQQQLILPPNIIQIPHFIRHFQQDNPLYAENPSIQNIRTSFPLLDSESTYFFVKHVFILSVSDVLSALEYRSHSWIVVSLQNPRTTSHNEALIHPSLRQNRPVSGKWVNWRKKMIKKETVF